MLKVYAWLNARLNSLRLMWFLFSNMIKLGFKGDWEGSREASVWLRIHLMYRSKYIKGRSKKRC